MALNYEGNLIKTIKFNGGDVQKVQIRSTSSDEYSTVYEIITKTENFLFSGTTLQFALIDQLGNTFYTTSEISKTISDTQGTVLEVLSAEAQNSIQKEAIYSGPSVDGNKVTVALKNSKASTKTICSISVTYKLLKN